MIPLMDILLNVLFIPFALGVIFYMIHGILFTKQWFSPEGKTILITGCDSGIGFRIAEHFYNKGSIVFAGFLNSNSDQAKLLRHKCPNIKRFHIIQMDVTKNEQTKSAFDYVENYLKENDLKGLWALINNAGINVNGNFDWLTLEHCQSIININLIGTIRVIKYFLPLIFKAQGRIINISSTSGSFATGGIAAYTASKFGVEGLSHCLRLELAQHGIKVILIKPGAFTKFTNINANLEKDLNEMWNCMDDEKKKFYNNHYQEIINQKKIIDSVNPSSINFLLPYYEEAVYVVNPRVYITCAPIMHKIFFMIISLLPFTWSDNFTGITIKLLEKFYLKNNIG